MNPLISNNRNVFEKNKIWNFVFIAIFTSIFITLIGGFILIYHNGGISYLTNIFRHLIPIMSCLIIALYLGKILKLTISNRERNVEGVEKNKANSIKVKLSISIIILLSGLYLTFTYSSPFFIATVIFTLLFFLCSYSMG